MARFQDSRHFKSYYHCKLILSVNNFIPIHLLCLTPTDSNKTQTLPSDNQSLLPFCSPSTLISVIKEVCTPNCNYLLVFLFFCLDFQYYRSEYISRIFESPVPFPMHDTFEQAFIVYLLSDHQCPTCTCTEGCITKSRKRAMQHCICFHFPPYLFMVLMVPNLKKSNLWFFDFTVV